MIYGGTLVAEGDDRWTTVGHEGAYIFNGTDYLIFHGYDKTDNGMSKRIIKTIKWINEWPTISLD